MSAFYMRVKRGILLVAVCLAALFAISIQVAAQDDPALWYDVQAINPGLDAPSREVDRSSPRATLRSFVNLAEAGDLGTASHILNLSQLPPDQQKERGSELAGRLASIIDRKLPIDWAGLPAEQDARTTANLNDQEGSERQRDYLLEEFDVDGQIYAIRLTRYAEETAQDEAADPVWLFSRDTVDNIDVLYDAFGPRAFEAHIPDGMKVRIGWLQLWEWFALPLVIGVVALVGMLTSRMVRLGRYVSDNRVARRTFDRAALPLSLVAAAIAAHALLGIIVSLSGPVNAVITPVLVMLAVVGLSLAALRAVDALLDHVTRRHLGDTYDTPTSSEREFYTSMYALRRIILVVTVGFALVFVLMQFDIFADMGLTLLASAGVLTVILGIAGQVTLGNMVASLQIAIAKPVRIGDNIHYEGGWCIVEAIYFTFIQLRTWDDRRLIVPVKYFLSYPFKNWSVIDERMLITVRLVLDPMAEVAVLRDKFSATAKADPGVVEHDKLCTAITDHSAHGMTVEFYAMVPDPWTAWLVEMRLREELVNFVRIEHPGWWWRDRVTIETQAAGGR